MATQGLSTMTIPRSERRGSIALVLLVAVLLVAAAAGLMMVEESLLTIGLFCWLFLKVARESEERQTLLDAAAAQGAPGGQVVAPPDPNVGGEEGPSEPTARRSASGSAMQQLRSTSGG